VDARNKSGHEHVEAARVELHDLDGAPAASQVSQQAFAKARTRPI
jgi:hypothetical protein